MQEDQLLDKVMLQLRLSDGLDLQELQQQFGPRVVAALLPVIQQMMQKGLMQEVPPGNQQAIEQGTVADMHRRLGDGQSCRVRLTDPRGFLLSNDVIAELFAVLDPSMLGVTVL